MTKSADAFRTISEVADWLGVQTHVLRFWESKFIQVKPVKRAGGRRYYRPADMKLLGGIQKLLYEDGLTIKGVQKILREKSAAHVSALSPALNDAIIDSIIIEPGAPAVADAEPQSTTILPLVQKTKVIDLDERQSLIGDGAEAESFNDKNITENVEATSLDNVVSSVPTEIKNDFPVTGGNVERIEPEGSLSSSVGYRSEEPSETTEDEPTNRASLENISGPSVSEKNLFPEPIAKEAADSFIKTEGVAVVGPEPELEHEHDESVTNGSDPLLVIPTVLSPSKSTQSPEKLGEHAHKNPVIEPHAKEVLKFQMAQEKAEVEFEPEIELPKKQAPIPLTVDLPEPQAEHEIQTSPRALAALSKADALTFEQASIIAPLLAQLCEARNRMMLAHKE